MKLTIDSKIKDIWALPEIAPTAEYFIGGSREWYEKLSKFSFREIQAESPTWNAEAMRFGAERLIAIAKSNKPFFYDVYTDTETADDPRKKNVKLFHFPGKPEFILTIIKETRFSLRLLIIPIFPLVILVMIVLSIYLVWQVERI